MEELNLVQPNNIDSIDAGKAEFFAATTSQMEQFSQPLDSCEVEKTKKVGKCNMRKSLAWDAAFFTSAGVLDPDELSSMIGGGSSGKMQVLPGIEEDLQRSTDSLSTLGSENLTLESLEADLFEDIRASIQKSSRASYKTKFIEAASGDAGAQAIHPLKEDLSSNNVVKSGAGLKKQTSGMQASGKLNVETSNSPQGTQSVARTRVSSPTLPKATKANSRSIPGSSLAVARSSLRTNQVQLETGKAKALGKMAPASKVPGSSGIKRTVPKPVLPSKTSFSSFSTATKKELPKLSSSSDSSTSITSANSHRRKIAARSVNPTSSKSIVKPPSKLDMKKKGDNDSSASLRSSKVSSSISPASSISEWSMASSSSTSSVNQCSNTLRSSIGAGSPRKTRDNSAPLKNIGRSTNRGLNKHENKVSRPNSEKSNAATAQRGQPPKPAKPSSTRLPLPNSEKPNAASAQKEQPFNPAKPSGLRMPSPKIGFFDGVKSGTRTPNGSSLSRSGVPSSPKVGPVFSTPTGVPSSKSKSPKLQSTRLANPVWNINLDTDKSASPITCKKVSIASSKVHSSPKDVETPLFLSQLTHNERDEEKFSKTEEAGSKVGPIVSSPTAVSLSKAKSPNLQSTRLANPVVNINLDTEKSSSPITCIKVSISSSKVHSSPKDVDPLCLPQLTHNERDEEKFSIIEEAGTKELCETNGGQTENFNLVDVEKKTGASLVNLEVVSMDRAIYDSKGKMASTEKNNGEKFTVEKNNITDSMSDLDLKERTRANLVNSRIVLVDGDICGCEGKSDDVKLKTENNLHGQVICQMNLDEKKTANSVTLNVAPINGDIYEADDGKSKMHCLINNWNSCHKSAEKENQVRGLNIDVGHGHSEHDLLKENVSNYISSPRDCGKTEELSSNLSKIIPVPETIASTRTPFTDKNSPCNDEKIDIATEYLAVEVEKATLVPSLGCPLAENL